MAITWSALEGVTLSGQTNLGRWVGQDDAGVFFSATVGPDAQPALVKLVPDVLPAGDIQLVRWRRTARLRHPNLLALLDCGHTAVKGDPFLFAVFELPEDRLSVALESGPLGPAEARGVLAALLQVLPYLHEQGLVHGAVDPAHIVAVGEQIQLSSDSLRESGPAADPSGDVRGLGETLYQLLTATRIDSGAHADLASIPEPLRRIISNTVGPDPRARWTLPQIAAAIDPAARAAVPGAPTRPAAVQRRPKPFPRWIYAVYAAVVLGAIFWINHNAPPLSPPPPPVGAPVTAPGPAASPPARPQPPQPAAKASEKRYRGEAAREVSGATTSAPASASRSGKPELAPAHEAAKVVASATPASVPAPASRSGKPDLAPVHEAGKAVSSATLPSAPASASRPGKPDLAPVHEAGKAVSSATLPSAPASASRPGKPEVAPAHEAAKAVASATPPSAPAPASRAVRPEVAPAADATRAVATATPPSAPAPRPGKPEATPAREAAKAVSGTVPPSAPRVWRLIAFTYRGRAAAEKQVRDINAKWPGFHAEVFSVAARPGLYMVALGGRMTRPEAVTLLSQAKAAGLPRGVYIQNYAQ